MKISQKSGKVTAIVDGKVGLFTVSPHPDYFYDTSICLTDAKGNKYELSDFEERLGVYYNPGDDGTIYDRAYILTTDELAVFPPIPDEARLHKNATKAAMRLMESVADEQNDADDLRWALDFLKKPEYIYADWLACGNNEEQAQENIVNRIFFEEVDIVGSRYIQAPAEIPDVVREAVFIAGGISNCPNWQEEIAPLLTGTGYDVFNPRRIGDLSKEGAEAAAQIAWEYDALSRSVVVIFWFPKESICPITLLEYGKALVWFEQGKIDLVVGCDEEYPRRFDLEEQTKLLKNEELVVNVGFEAFKSAVRNYFDE